MVKAVAVLTSSEGVTGSVFFAQEGDGLTTVTGSLSGLKPGQHGFHVHALDDTANGCVSTGPHFNPAGEEHGSPEDETHHAGDLGNITVGEDAPAAEEECESLFPNPLYSVKDLTPSLLISSTGSGKRMRERGNKVPVKSNNVNDGGFPIPLDIEGMVISNLPTKSLLRFQCISKSWRHMISDFCATQFERLTKSNPSNCIICTEGTGLTCPYSLLKLKNGRLEHEELKLELGPKIISCRVKCSYNGLVLLRARYDDWLYYILWNPSIRKWRKISFPHMDMGTTACNETVYSERYEGHGICYDKISGGVKIVLLSRKKLLVYSCKSSIWSSKDYISDPLYCDLAVSADGAVYWETMVEVRNGCEMYLLKFDSKDDQLHSIQMPECVGLSWVTRYNLSTLRDTLYVWSIRSAERLMGLWVLKEDHSWMKLMNITYELPSDPWRIWFMNDSNDILVNLSEKTSSRFYTCNLANKVFTSNGSYFRGLIEGGKSIDYFHGFAPYVDCPFFAEIEEAK